MLYAFPNFSLTKDLQTREIAFADDLTVAAKLTDTKNFRDKLATNGCKYGFFHKFTKLCLIVKKKFLKDAKNKSISTDGRKHLGAVVGSDTYKVWYVKDLVNN